MPPLFFLPFDSAISGVRVISPTLYEVFGNIARAPCAPTGSAASSFPSQGYICLLKASCHTVWPCNLGSDCWRPAKVREGAERPCLEPLSLGLGAAFKLGLISWRMPEVSCRCACAWHHTLPWLCFADPGLVPASSLQTGLDGPGLLAYLVTVTRHALLTLLSDQLPVGEAPAQSLCCHPWLLVPLNLQSSPYLLLSEKHSGSLESFQQVNFYFKKTTKPKPTKEKNPNSKQVH